MRKAIRAARARRFLAAASVFVLVGATAACGTRRTHEEMLEATSALGPAPTVDAAGETTADTASAGEESAADDPSAPSSGASSPSGQATPGSAGGVSGVPAGSAGTPDTAQDCASPKSTIVIGTVGHQSGVLGAYLAPGAKAVQAWVKSINAGGGLRCHPVKYVVYDDGGDPSRNQSLTRQLVERDKAIALVYAGAPLAGSAAVDYINEHRIPVIGSEGSSAWFDANPMYFPQMASGFQIPQFLYGSTSRVAKAEGLTKIGTIECIETPICSSIGKHAPTWTKRNGTTSVYSAQTTIAQPDYSSLCQGAQEAGAQAVLVLLDGNSLLRVARSCASVNYRPLLATEAIVGTMSQFLDPSLDGLVLGAPVLPWIATDNPAIAEFRSTMARYAPNVSMESALSNGWAAAKLFELAAQNISDQPTNEEILDGLWSIKDNDLGGLVQPLTFTRDQPTRPAQTCWWILQTKDGEVISPNGGERICEPSS